MVFIQVKLWSGLSERFKHYLVPTMRTFFLLAVAQASQPSYEEWAAMYGINGEEPKDKYNANVVRIDKLNAEANQTATFAVNKFSGMSFDEFSATYLTLKQEHWPLANMKAGVERQSLGEPSHCGDQECDWYVTAVKNQGGCGSCWAYATMAVIESVHLINTGETVSLSEQQLIDCTDAGSCAGGNFNAFNALANTDIYSSSSYPYTASDGDCNPQGPPSNVRISGYRAGCSSCSDVSFHHALRESPMAVTLFADERFQHYSNGILRGVPSDCKVNHGVLAMGFGGPPRDGAVQDYLKIKNSWGTDWGEDGFIRFEATTDGCGAFGIWTAPPVIPTDVSVVEGLQV